MKIVGLTGGIGSGKTTVTRMFEELGVPVYISDDRAKQLMNGSPVIKSALIEAFGTGSYDVMGNLDRKYLAQIVFEDKEALQKINAIVHPEVGRDFTRWAKEQHAAYVIKETAILFENGLHHDCDLVVTVTAPLKERIERVMKRDNVSEEQVLARSQHQWSDEQKAERSDFVILNVALDDTLDQVRRIHKEILALEG